MNASMVKLTSIECLYCHQIPIRPFRCLICRIYACEDCVKSHLKQAKAEGGKFHCNYCWVPGFNYERDAKVENLYQNYERFNEINMSIRDEVGCRRCGVIFKNDTAFYVHKEQCKRDHPKKPKLADVAGQEKIL